LELLFKRVAAIIEGMGNKAEGNGTSSLCPGFLICTELCRRYSKKHTYEGKSISKLQMDIEL
jgi:hypothetical protein